MKRTLAVLLGSLMILSACSSGEDTAEESGQETADESSEQNPEEAAETSSDASSDEEGNLTSADLISSAVENSDSVTSYEAAQTINITNADDESTIRTIMTYGEQNEFKLSVNNNGDILTHYVVDGDHFIYQNNEILNSDETMEAEGGDYQTIVSSLENYPEGEVSELEEGYAVTVNIEDASAFGNGLDEETASAIEAADSINGTLQLYFNADHVFTGSELEADIVSEGEEINVHSTVDYTDIGNIEMIEKPHNMSE